MQLATHSEYPAVYLTNAAAFAQCQAAIAQWQASDKPIPVERYGLTWTPAKARRFVADVAQLFQAYNQVLWENFSYCRQCGGQCCVVGASDVRLFDLLAVALLHERAPHLPERIAANAQACIYLNGQQCSWPGSWRTVKCWSFYCLGSGPWPDHASLGELYQAVTADLVGVVAELLPKPLRRYETNHHVRLIDYLDDPVAFAHQFHSAVEAVFVTPFLHQQPALADLVAQEHSPPQPGRAGAHRHKIALQLSDDAADENGLGIIAAISEELLQAEAEGGEELLADLETLAWILESRPAQAQALLREMAQRYAHAAPPAEAGLLRPWQQLQAYLRSLLENRT